MKVALVWPSGQLEITFPLGLALLKSNLDNAKHEVKIFDCFLMNLSADSPEFVRRLKEFDPDVVGVSSWTTQAPEAIRILRTAKSLNKNVVTVIGGVHASAYPDKTIREAGVDYLFQGEGELCFPVFLEELEKEAPDWSRVKGLVWLSPSGELLKNEMDREENLDKVKLPDYDALNLDAYTKEWYSHKTVHYCDEKKIAPIWITRGCPYICQYCTAPMINGRSIRAPSVEYVVEWVKYLYHKQGTRHINILDDNFTFDVDYCKAVCKAIIAENLKGLKFEAIVGIRQERTDDELFGLLRQMGWSIVTIAPESGSLRTLKRMKKNMDPDAIPAKVQQVRNAGLKALGFFMIGYPGETEQDLKETKNLILKSKFNYVHIFTFRPLPGTPIYDELIKNGELTEEQLLANTDVVSGYLDGERGYTTKTLKGFNFSKFVLETYVAMALKEPLNIPFLLKAVTPGRIIRRVYELTISSITKAVPGLSFISPTFKKRVRQTRMLEARTNR